MYGTYSQQSSKSYTDVHQGVARTVKAAAHGLDGDQDCLCSTDGKRQCVPCDDLPCCPVDLLDVPFVEAVENLHMTGLSVKFLDQLYVVVTLSECRRGIHTLWRASLTEAS